MSTQTTPIEQQLNFTSDTQGVESGVERTKQKLRELGGASRDASNEMGQGMSRAADQAEQAARRTDGATRSLMNSLTREAAALDAAGKSRADYYRALAERRGANMSELEPYLRGLEEAKKRQDALTNSTRLTSQQMGQLAPQMTDFFTQVASGGSPVTALIQQGGQLKDMFGGVGEAAKMVGKFIMEMITPMSVAAGAAAAIFIAYEQGAKEAHNFTRAIVLTGNAAGVTVGQLQGLAKAMSETTGATQGAAAAALTEFVSQSVAAGTNLQRFAELAMKIESTVGTPIADTAKAFKQLGEEPLDALIKLNDGTNFLTQSVYEQVKSLEEQGRYTEAAKVAMEAYADAMEGRTSRLAGNMGLLEKAVKAVTGAAKAMWDALLNIGRPMNYSDTSAVQKQIDFLTKQIEAAEKAGNVNGGDGGKAEQLRAQLRMLVAQVQGAEAEAVAAKYAEQSARAAEARIKWDQQGDSLAGKRAQKEKEIAQAKQWAKDMMMGEVELAKRLAEIEEKYKEKPKGKSAADRAAERERLRWLEEERRIMVQQAGLTTTFHAEWDAITRLFQKGVISLEALERAQSKLLKDQPGIKKQTEADLKRYVEQWQAAEQIQSELAAAEKESDDRKVKMQLSVSDYAEAVANQNAQSQLELSLMGESETKRKIAIEQFKITLDLKRRLKEIDETQGVNIDEAWREGQRDKLRQAAQEAMDGAEQAAYLESWNKTTDQVGQALADALMQGGKSAWEYIKGLIRTQVLRPVIQAVMSPITGGIAMLMGQGNTGAGWSAGGGGASGTLGMVSNAAGLYNTASGLYTAGTIGAQWAAGTMSTANATGTLYANAVGGGIDALLATNGAYGTAAATTTGSAAGAAGGAGGGGMGAVGTVAAWAAIILAVLNVFGVFRSNRVVGGGLAGTVGDVNDIDQYKLHRRGGTLIDGPSYRYSMEDADAEISKAISDSVGQLLTNVRERAGIVGTGANIASFQTRLGNDQIHPDTGGYGINLTGLNAEEAQKKVKEALDDVAIKMAEQALGTQGMALAKEGENAAQTLARLSDSLTNVRAVFHDMGRDIWGVSLQMADSASKLVDAFGGFDQLTQSLSVYYETMYTEQERNAQSAARLAEEFGKLGMAVPATERHYRALVDSVDLQSDAGRTLYKTLIDLAPAWGAVNQAAREAAELQAEAAARAADQKAQLEGQELELQGNTAEIRRRALLELENDENRAIQKRIWLLEDAKAAADAAAAAEAERAAKEQAKVSEGENLTRQLLDLQDNTAELRRRQLLDLHADNRAIQEQIWALQDKIEADRKAAEAAAEAAAKAEELRREWTNVGQGIKDEIDRIRGSAGGEASLAALQADFAIKTAAARAGDQEAAKELPALSRAMLEAADKVAASQIEMERWRQTTANSLEQTLRAIAAAQGITIPGFATGGHHVGGARIVGERGPELEFTGPSYIVDAQRTLAMFAGGGLERAVDALRREVSELRADVQLGQAMIVQQTRRTAEVLEASAEGVNALTFKAVE